MKFRPLFVLGLFSVFLAACSKKPEAAHEASSATPPVIPTAPALPAAPVAMAPPAAVASPPSDASSRGPERARQRLAQMETNLGLSPEQTRQITALFAAQRPAMEALRADTALSREARREKLRELRQKTDSEVAALLTPEQKDKWDQLRAERRQDDRRPGGGQTPSGPGEAGS